METERRMKVLVVDDKEENRRLLRKVLVLNGYDVAEAATGEAAIEAATAWMPDLILMDLRLREGIDGIETTVRLKSMPEARGIPVVAITASVSPQDIERAIDSGCIGFIRKPVDIDELPGLVAHYLAGGVQGG
jgi:two-component system cell cycle response regulator DivK